MYKLTNILKVDPEEINVWLVKQYTQACSGCVLVLH